MKFNDSSIQNKVVEVLQSQYGLDISSIDFIPVGEESYAYKVIGNSSIYFVKYCDKPNIVKGIETVNQLLAELNQFDFVVTPLHSEKGFSAKLNSASIYLYPFVEGELITKGNSEWDSELVLEVIKIMPQIHNADVTNPDLPRETFDNDFDERFEKLQSIIDHFDKDILQLLEANKEKIARIISTYSKTGDKYKTKKIPFVLTHGDVTGLNIIRTDSGLKLVDWDGAMFAPPERDINFLYDNPNFSLDTYSELTGYQSFTNELRDYYGQKWALDSIIGNFESLITDGKSKSNKSEYVEEIEEYLSYY